MDYAKGGEDDFPELSEEMHDERLKKELTDFWNQQQMEMDVLSISTEQDFKNHNDLPLARIKRIMKSDEDVRMISAEAPGKFNYIYHLKYTNSMNLIIPAKVLFAKACEMFILELTLRSWNCSEKSKRRTLQKDDVESAIGNTDIFDFLVGLQP